MKRTVKQAPGRLVGIRRDRASLLRSTALQAAVLVAIELPGGLLPAAAQPAPNARPQGGRVVAGQASISQNPNTTTIDQSSQRAAINWNSFNVGGQQTVDFQQPSASAITLNRVTGADPSQIAGHIEANGQVVLTNPSGVVFYRGSEVNAQSLVVSAPGITNRNFMAGRMVFNRAPHPNARIVNAGSITVKQAGLAALVAPQVRNSGVITAQLGHVVLAGALAHTIDMYGDGLLSFDVTRQVTQVPHGPDGRPATALVTNSGTILASGGTVQLTARAADGIVQNLVDAKGRIEADSVGSQTGRIVLDGTGGSVVIAGTIAAAGTDPGTRGGQIELDASSAVRVASGARVDASGRAGGGTVALGTTLARARGGPSVTPKLTAERTVIARGASVAADATGRGRGGKVTVLSTEKTAMRGRITARGGTRGGHGGLVEVSGENGFALTGVVDVAARGVGQPGTVLLDPTDLDIIAGAAGSGNLDGTLATGNGTIEYNVPDGGTPSTVTAGELQNLITLGDNIALQAAHDLDVRASINGNFGNSIDLRAGHLLTVESGVTIAGASIRLDGGEIFPVTNPAALPTGNGGVVVNGTLIANGGDSDFGGTVEVAGGSLGVVVNGMILATGEIFLSGGGSTGVQLNATSVLAGSVFNVSTFFPTNLVDLNTTGSAGVTQDPAGQILTSEVQSSNGISGTASLLGTANQVSSLGNIAGAADFTLKDASLLVVGGTVSVGTGHTLTLIQDQLVFDGASLVAPGGTVALAPLTPGRPLDLGSAGNAGTLDILPSMLSAITASTLQIGSATAGTVNIGDVVGNAADTIDLAPIPTLNVQSGAAVTEGGVLVVGTLAGSAGAVTLANANSIATLGSFSATGGLSLTDAQGLTVAGPVTDPPGISLNVAGPLPVTGVLSAPTVSLIATGAITEPGGTIVTGTLSGSGSSVALTGTANSIGTLAGFAATTGDFALTNAGNLVIGGAVASGGTVDLVATGAITEAAGGSIAAATLAGSAGSATLTGGTDTIANLGNFTTGTGFALTDATSLTVGGPVTDGASIALTSAGPLTIAGTIAAPLVDLTANIGTTGSFAPSPGNIIETAGSIGGSTGVVLTAAGSIDQTGGVLTAGTLSGSSGSTTALPGAGNAVANLGSFSSVGGFALADGQALAVAGPVTDTVSIGLGVTGALALAGTLTAPDISLTATGAISQPGGALIATTLAGSGDGVALGQAANSIGTLGAFTSALDFALTDGVPLTVGSGVSAGAGHTLTLADNQITFGTGGSLAATSGTIVLEPLPGQPISLTGTGTPVPASAQTLVLGSTSASAVTLAGSLDLSGVNVLDLLSAGAISEATGTVLNVGTLTGAGGSATLNATNTVATLGSFATTSGISLTDGTALTVAGPVSDGTDITLNIAGALALGGTLSAPTISLTATGAITEPGGTIVTGTLSGSGSSVALTGTANSIGTLAGFAATTGDFALTNAGNLVIGGAVASGGTVDLVATGAITEAAGGSIAAATLAGSAGSATLTGGTDTIANLGNFTTGTGFALTDATSLTVGGPVADGVSIALTSTGPLTVAGSIAAPTVDLTATNLTVRGRVTAPGDILETAGSIGGSTGVVLTAAGSIDQTGGVLTAGTLSGSSGSTTALPDAGNAVANLGSFSSVGGFTLADGQALAVAGPVTDTVSIGLGVTGALALAGTLTAPDISLTATGAISQPGGALIATTLAGSGDGVALGQAANSIGTLGAFTSALDFALTDGVPLTVGSGVSAGAGHTLTLADNQITFGTGGSLAATSGTIVLEPLPGQPISLTGTGTPVPASAQTLVLGSTSASAVTLAGSLDLSGVNVLDLLSAGAISEATGTVLNVGTLTGAGGSATLNATNTVATLGSFATTSGISLTDGTALTVAGPVSDGTDITLNIAGALALGGTLSAPTISLTATGAITEPGGTIVTGTLSGSGSSVALTGTANSIGTLAGFAATTGDFALTNAGNLVIGGAVASGGTVDLVATGAITEAAGGSIAAATLAGSAGSATLTGGTDTIANLGNFTTGTGFALTDATSLTVGGPVADGVSIALTSTGPLTVAGSIAAPTVDLTATNLTVRGRVTAPGDILETAGSIGGSTGVVLTAAGSIDQTGGVLTAGTLSGSSGSTTALPDAGNAVANLGSFSSVGGFTLADGQALAVAGPVTDTVSIGLGVTGALALAGTLTAPDISLTATGAISQPGGALIATTLAGSGDGVALGQAANSIGTLGAFTSALDFALTDGVPLTVGSGVSAGAGHTLTLADNQITFGTGGSLAATSGTIVLEPLPGQPISLTGTGTPVPASAQTLVLGSTSASAVTLAGSLDLSGVNVLDLLSAGAISEATGTVLNVGTLTGAGGSATLNATNTVATLGSFATTSGISLTDGTALTVAGPVSDGVSIALASLGPLTVAGGLTAPTINLAAANLAASPGNIALTAGNLSGGSVVLAAGGSIAQTGGALTAGLLSGSSAATTSLTGAGNAIGILGSFTSSGGFALTDGQALTVAGPLTDTANIALNVAGALALAGPLTAPATSLIATGAITEPGGVVTTNTLSGSGASANLGSANAIGTLGAFSTPGGTLTLVDGTALQITGPLSADDLAITATGSIVLAGGTIMTLGLPLAQQLGAQPAPPGSYFIVLPDTTGSGTFLQTGITTIDPPNGVVPTLRIQVPDTGTIALDDLVGPTANLVLADLAGPMSGTIDVGALSVIGQSGLADLFGTVAGISGTLAAPIATITPAINPNYLLNNCIIMSATCGIVTPPAPPPPAPIIVVPPIGDVDLLVPPNTFGRGFLPGEDQIVINAALAAAGAGAGLPLIGAAEPDQDELDLLLPNISDRDY